jgi:epoxyqueuosine reductase
MTFSEEIKRQAFSLGFDACGICRAHDSGKEGQYRQWLSEGAHAGMSYLVRNVEKRLDPRLLVEGARSIVSVALNYYPRQKQPGGAPRFAYYAYGKDYHEVMWEKLEQLFLFIKGHHPEVTGRYFCDSAPVLEQHWAAQAGIGFVGKNTLLIIPGRGSFFFLGEIILSLELEYDNPIDELCGECRKCLDFCPTGAIERPYWLNSGKCISYQTIENRGEIAPEVVPSLRNNVYGCDICQLVCPFNREARPHDTPQFVPSEEFLSLDWERLTEMDEDGFHALFRHSAVKRGKFAGLKRNVVAISKTREK